MMMFSAVSKKVKVQADVVLGKPAWSVVIAFGETVQERMVIGPSSGGTCHLASPSLFLLLPRPCRVVLGKVSSFLT